MIARPASGAAKAGWNLTAKDLDEAVEAPAKAYALSPDSKWIAIIAEDGETAARAAQVKKKDDSVQIGRDDQNKQRLYIVDAATGAAREVALPDDAAFAVTFARSDRTVRWTKESGTLLTTAESAGLTLPSGCRVGQCESCACPVLSGNAAHLVAPDEGLPDTSVLTCQSVPTSDLVLDA